MGVTAVILAGGKGQRMGGVDKGWVKLSGQALIHHVINRLSPQVSEILINANRELPQYQSLGYTVIEDSLDGYLGPLAGLLSAMQHAKHDYILSVPCDSPLLPLDLCARLSAALAEAQADIAVATVNGKSQPVFSLCKKSLMPQLEQYILDGGRKVDSWQKSNRYIEVNFDDAASAFSNINTPDELAAMEQQPHP